VLPIKVILDDVPRSGVGASDFSYRIPWDSRDSSGTIVSNGIYRMMIRASDNTGVVDTVFTSFPIDIMRFMDLSATGITATASEANISYDINAAGFVSLIFCSTGTRFIQATTSGSLTLTSGASTYSYQYEAGDNLPADADGTVNQARLLRVMKFYRESGEHTESWDGTDQSGTALPRGIYTFAISAKDDYGNIALDSSGNDGPIAGSITIDADSPSSGTGGGTGGSTGGGGSSSDTVDPVISAVSPSNGSTVTGGLTSISAILTDSGSGIDGRSSVIVVRNSSGTRLSGTGVYNSTTGVLTFTLTTGLGRAGNGNYAVTVQAVDNAGNSTLSSSVFTLDVVDSNIFASGTIPYSYPNPVASAASGMMVAFDTTRAVPVTFQVFNILGELIYEKTFDVGAGSGQTLSWNLLNEGGSRLSGGVYLYRLKASDSMGEQSVMKKFVVAK
jgi:hypothetical protein